MTKTVTLTIKDAKGQTARCEANLPTGTGQVTAVNFAEEFAIAVNSFIGGAVVAIAITDNIALPEEIAENVPDVASDVEEGGLFIFRTENDFTTKIRLPSMAERVILAGTKQIDLTDTDVDAFVDLMIDGVTDIVNGDALPSDTRDDDIVSVASAKENFRPRKGE